MSTVEEAKSLICELCADYYKQGWVSGTGGGMSIRAGDKIVMAPSGSAAIPLLQLDLSSGIPPPPPPFPACSSIATMQLHRQFLRAGVPKERMQPSDMFVLDAAGAVLETPTARPPPYKPPKLSECSPLFMAVRRRSINVPT